MRVRITALGKIMNYNIIILWVISLDAFVFHFVGTYIVRYKIYYYINLKYPQASLDFHVERLYNIPKLPKDG